ncbi:MAG TPA: hypothetical protein VFQ39_03005 [Longimicrobium sp.]|nr:hypothetical protein [Longimicrobium sp.]
MAIDLAPDLEKALDDEARRQGTTADQLADDVLRAHLHLPSRVETRTAGPRTLADLLGDSIGLVPDAGFEQSQTDFASRSREVYADDLQKRWEQSQR